MRGALHCRLDELQQLQCKGGAQQIVLLAVESTLNLLPCGSWTIEPGIFQFGERGEPLAGVLDKSLAHLLCQELPACDKSRRVLLVARPQFVVDNAGQHLAQLRKTPCPRQLGDGLAKLTAWRPFCRHLQQLVLQTAYVDAHPQRPHLLSLMPSMVNASVKLMLLAGKVLEWEASSAAPMSGSRVTPTRREE
jgi:hypothetical protein